MKLAPKGLFDDKSAKVLGMACHPIDDKPLAEPMAV